jgi:hypothetical protein
MQKGSRLLCRNWMTEGNIQYNNEKTTYMWEGDGYIVTPWYAL